MLSKTTAIALVAFVAIGLAWISQTLRETRKRHGEKACPFNSLYWDFYHRHTDKLAKNPRIGMAYQVLKKMDETELEQTLAQAKYYKKVIETL